jgi:hypothetical protein
LFFSIISIHCLPEIFIYLKLLNFYFAIFIMSIIMSSMIWYNLKKYRVAHFIIIPILWLVLVLKYYIKSFIIICHYLKLLTIGYSKKMK